MLDTFDKKWVCISITSGCMFLIGSYLVANDFFDSQNDYDDPFSLHLDNNSARQNLALGFMCTSALCCMCSCIPFCFSSHLPQADIDPTPFIPNKQDNVKTDRVNIVSEPQPVNTVR